MWSLEWLEAKTTAVKAKTVNQDHQRTFSLQELELSVSPAIGTTFTTSNTDASQLPG
jgi:hypothetical protein